MIYYQVETLKSFWDALQPLLDKHHQEVRAHIENDKPAPNYENYKRMEDAGCFRIFTARDGMNELVGYLTMIVMPSVHYGVLSAHQDAFFILPEYRGRGSYFLGLVEDWLKAEGVKKVYQHVTTKCDFSSMLKRNGYEDFERVFVKCLT